MDSLDMLSVCLAHLGTHLDLIEGVDYPAAVSGAREGTNSLSSAATPSHALKSPVSADDHTNTHSTSNDK